MRALASEFDIELDSDRVFDHTSFNKDDHSLIATDKFVGPSAIIDKKALDAPVLYSGTGLTVGQLPLSTSILTATSDAFVAEDYTKRASTADTITLVGAMQSRNSARVTFVGSLDIFSDKLISSSVKIGSDKT